MSDASSPPPADNVPDGIPAPPPPRPPDLKDLKHEGPTYGSESTSKKKKKERTHPTDPYEPLKKKKGCGCCGCLGGSLVAVLLLLVALAAAVVYIGPGRYVSEGYTVVNLEEPVSTIATAPEVPTLYIGRAVTYDVPVTSVPVAIFAREVLVSGDFLKEVSLSGVKVTGSPTARFAQGLEIYAAEFTDQGITLKGELTGRVMKSLP